MTAMLHIIVSSPSRRKYLSALRNGSGSTSHLHTMKYLPCSLDIANEVRGHKKTCSVPPSEAVKQPGRQLSQHEQDESSGKTVRMGSQSWRSGILPITSLTPLSRSALKAVTVYSDRLAEELGQPGLCLVDICSEPTVGYVHLSETSKDLRRACVE